MIRREISMASYGDEKQKKGMRFKGNNDYCLFLYL